MTFKKTGLTYITAVLGAVCSLVTLFLWLVPFYGYELGLSGKLFDTPVEYSHLAAAGTVILAVLLFFLIRFIKRSVFSAKERKPFNKGLFVALSVLSCAVLFAGGIYLIYSIGTSLLLDPSVRGAFEDAFALSLGSETGLLYGLAITFVYDIFGAVAPVYLI
ncbi:MAG: hypothetical protein ILP13_07195, partial [Lachnospiraceae bacterium]|nr:hypothetical protein [Lachnospiraceae bacterium]